MSRVAAGTRVAAGNRAAATLLRFPLNRGMAERNNQPSFGYDDSQAIPVVVCNVRWDDLQPVEGGPLSGSTRVLGTLTAALPQGVWSGPNIAITATAAVANAQAVIRIGSAQGFLVGISNPSAAGTTSLSVSAFKPDVTYPPGTSVYLLGGTDAIDAFLAWAAKGGTRTVKLRVGGRGIVPAWALSYTDPASINLLDGQSATPFSITDKNASGKGALSGAFWGPSHRLAVQKFWALLAARYGQSPYLGAVDVGLGANTLGDEPMVALHCVDTGGVNNVQLPSAMAAAMAGASGVLVATAINYFPGDAVAAWAASGMWCEFAINPYFNLLVGSGSGARIPQVITASSQAGSTISVAGTPWTAGDYTGVVAGNGNYFAAGVCRCYGKFRTNPAGLTALVGYDNFGIRGVIAGDIVYSDGNTYTVVSLSTTFTANDTINITAPHDGSGDDTAFEFFVVPAAVAAGPGYAITGNTAGQLTGVVGLPVDGTLNGLYVLPVGVAFQTGPGADQTTVKNSFLPTLAALNQIIESNHSARVSSQLFTGAPFKDMAGTGKAPYAEQTADDANINGSDVSGVNPLWTTCFQLLNSPIRSINIELPVGYQQSWTGVTTGIASGGNLVVNDTNLPNAGANTWGNGNGKLGVITFAASGNSYRVTSDVGSASLTVTSVLAGADQAAGLTYTVFKWSYLSPAQCRYLTNLCTVLGYSRVPALPRTPVV